MARGHLDGPAPATVLEPFEEERPASKGELHPAKLEEAAVLLGKASKSPRSEGDERAGVRRGAEGAVEHQKEEAPPDGHKHPDPHRRPAMLGR